MPRKYHMGRRRALVDETRQRIVDASLQLHSTKGPTRTSMQEIAALADVSLVTVYRHFPEPGDLFRACNDRFLEKFPPPGPEVFDGLMSIEERVKKVVESLYCYYDIVGDGLWRVMHDAEVVPELAEAVRQEVDFIFWLAAKALEPVGQRSPRYDYMLASLKLALDVATWRNLVRLQGLSSQWAAALMSDLVLCAAHPES